MHTPVSVAGDGITAKAHGWGLAATNLRVHVSFSTWAVSHMLQILGAYHEAHQLNEHENIECTWQYCMQEIILERTEFFKVRVWTLERTYAWVAAYANFVSFKSHPSIKRTKTHSWIKTCDQLKKEDIHTTSRVCHLKRNAIIHSSTISQSSAYGI